MKMSKLLTMLATTAIAYGIAGAPGVHAMSTYNQKQAAVTSIPKVNVVDNPNITRSVPRPYAYGKNTDRSGGLNHITVKSGSKSVSFTTSIYLNSFDSGVPQSAAIAGHYVYAMYNRNTSQVDDDLHDYIVRYDLNKVKDNQISDDGVKVGPTFEGGHGQSISYNPKTKQIWFLNLAKGSDTHAAAELINPDTLAPTRKINFKFASNGSSMDNTLSFDKYGRAYTYVKSGGGNVPTGAYKIYRGSITTKGVHFDLMKSAIRHPAGDIPQGMGYNPKSNRLYFISDGCIISIPASKVNNLKKSDIRYVNTNSNREFEGMVFDHSGTGYLLTLRPNEMMKMNGSF
ncbi:hypothetical protein ACYATO_07935 [Lactobacillaceae bacterium Melli_B3]